MHPPAHRDPGHQGKRQGTADELEQQPGDVQRRAAKQAHQDLQQGA